MMRNILTAVMLAANLVAVLATTGCTQMPTEKRGIADMRPQIAFKADSDRARAATVLVDGMMVGAVSDYLDGAAAIRILPGTHMLRVVSGNDVLLDEKFYLGDGVNRTFNVK